MNSIQSATAYIRRSMVYGLGEVRELMFREAMESPKGATRLDRRSIAMNEARVLWELTEAQEAEVDKRLDACMLHGDCLNGKVCENCPFAPIEFAEPVHCSTPDRCHSDSCVGCPFQLVADLSPIHGPGGLMEKRRRDIEAFRKTGMAWELEPEDGVPRIPMQQLPPLRTDRKFKNPVKGLKLSLYPIRRDS